ncbi:MAG: pyrroline-5-carboxylate reductase, partial [Candidatus Bathyarchaeia archaeon]
MTIAVIGAGAIGGAVSKGLLESKYRVVAAEKRLERRKELEKLGLTVIDDNKKAAKEAEIIILCVKPKDVKEVLKEIRNEIKEKLVISMAAAVNLGFLKKLAPESRFIRAMPNMAILVRESFTAYCVASDVAVEEKENAEKLLKTLGEVVEIDEAQMDAITALSGCAPAYLSIIVEAMTYAGLEVGLTRDLALSASAQAMIGTGKLILEAKKAPCEIKDMVTTP